MSSKGQPRAAHCRTCAFAYLKTLDLNLKENPCIASSQHGTAMRTGGISVEPQRRTFTRPPAQQRTSHVLAVTECLPVHQSTLWLSDHLHYVCRVDHQLRVAGGGPAAAAAACQSDDDGGGPRGQPATRRAQHIKAARRASDTPLSHFPTLPLFAHSPLSHCLSALLRLALPDEPALALQITYVPMFGCVMHCAKYPKAPRGGSTLGVTSWPVIHRGHPSCHRDSLFFFTGGADPATVCTASVNAPC